MSSPTTYKQTSGDGASKTQAEIERITGPGSTPSSSPAVVSDSPFKFFMVGGISGATASSVVHPVDTLKVRCQTLNELRGLKGERSLVNPLEVARYVFKQDGIRGFYRGLDSALLRQVTYSSGRLGIYKVLFDRKVKENGKVTFSQKLGYSLFAGFCGACVGNPADLTMVRRQADLALPENLRRNYGNVFSSLRRVVNDEGFFALWKGTPFTILRVCALTSGQLTTFDEVKERTRKWRGKPDDIYNRLAAASISGLICTSMALPFDNIKVKFQKMIKQPDGTWPYKNLPDVIMKTMRREGLAGFWAGFPAFYFLVGPHTLIMLLVQDYIHIMLKERSRRLH